MSVPNIYRANIEHPIRVRALSYREGVLNACLDHKQYGGEYKAEASLFTLVREPNSADDNAFLAGVWCNSLEAEFNEKPRVHIAQIVLAGVVIHPTYEGGNPLLFPTQGNEETIVFLTSVLP